MLAYEAFNENAPENLENLHDRATAGAVTAQGDSCLAGWTGATVD